MGISGLHSVVRPYLRDTHLSAYKGERVGCDAYAWLHRGACVWAAQLAEGLTQQSRTGTPPWLEFCINMVKMLLNLEVIPVIVMDGASLPAKAATQQARRERKKESLEKANAAALAGDQAGADALYAQTVDVTADMAHELVRHLRKMGVDFLVAPYEADSQLAFLASIPASRGGVAAVITEDSDLIAYGCARTLFKCDRGGHALELRLEDLFCPPPRQFADAPSTPAPLSFQHFTMDMLQAVCVLAGCDFLPSVKGVGVHKAHKLVKRYRMLSRAVTLLKDDRKLAVPREYGADAARAVRCFQHALVLDPSERGGVLTRLTPLPKKGANAQGLEPEPSRHVARGVAYGYLHPSTHERFPDADAAASSGQGKAAGWLKAASKALSPFKPSIRVIQPLSHVQPVPPPLISIADDHVSVSPSRSGLTSEVPSPSEGQQHKLFGPPPDGTVQQAPEACTANALTPSTLTSRSLLPQLEGRGMTACEPGLHADAAVAISVQSCRDRTVVVDAALADVKVVGRSDAAMSAGSAEPSACASAPGRAQQPPSATDAAADRLHHHHEPVAQLLPRQPAGRLRRKPWTGRCHSGRTAAQSHGSDADDSMQHAKGAETQGREVHEQGAAKGLHMVAETAPWDDGAELPAWILAGCDGHVAAATASTAAATAQPPAAHSALLESRPCQRQQAPEHAPADPAWQGAAQSAGQVPDQRPLAGISPLQTHASGQDICAGSLQRAEGVAGFATAMPCSPLQPRCTASFCCPAVICDSDAGSDSVPVQDGKSLSMRQESATANAATQGNASKAFQIESSVPSSKPLVLAAGKQQVPAKQPTPIAVDLTADENQPLPSGRQSTGGMQIRASPMWSYAAPSESKHVTGNAKKRRSTGSVSARQPRIQRFFVPANTKD